MNLERNVVAVRPLESIENVRVAADLLFDELAKVLADVSKTHEEIKAIKRELERSKASVINLPQKRRRVSHGRIGQGIKTPVESYFIPLLRALVMAGGTMPRQKVMAFVKNAMKNTLNQADLDLIQSSKTPRWEMTVDHARQKLIEMGLMKTNERKAIWEITATGRDWLQKSLSDR